MLLGSVPRNTRKRLLRILLPCLIFFTLVDVFLVLHYQTRPPSYPKRDINPARPHGRVFVSGVHWNNEEILLSHWNQAVVSLVQAIGPENVFVSVFESGSWDDTKSALKTLNSSLEALGVRRNITLDPTTHQDELSKTPASRGWVDTPRGKKEPRRISYLARLRNLSLRPLRRLERKGDVFDRVLFLNDVVFTVDDALTLLDTNAGNYAAACSLDFSNPPEFYDTFALRDSEGHGRVMSTWPYFRSRRSRRALKYNRPVPVASCWNGIVAMDAKPFYSAEPPLSFRAIPDTLAAKHLEGSECCLIHADNPLSPAKGVWLNPAVRVGYTGAAYAAVHGSLDAHDSAARSTLAPWLGAPQVLLGLWSNRLRRWFTTDRFAVKAVRKRVDKWAKEEPGRVEEGEFCVVDEMHVLVENGWAHV